MFSQYDDTPEEDIDKIAPVLTAVGIASGVYAGSAGIASGVRAAENGNHEWFSQSFDPTTAEVGVKCFLCHRTSFFREEFLVSSKDSVLTV
jgi:hypothetical protein